MTGCPLWQPDLASQGRVRGKKQEIRVTTFSHFIQPMLVGVVIEVAFE